MVPNLWDKNQGLKGSRLDQDTDFVSQDQDRGQDIKTESQAQDLSLENYITAQILWFCQVLTMRFPRGPYDNIVCTFLI